LGKNWIFDAFYRDLIGRSLPGATFLGSKKVKLAISRVLIFLDRHLCDDYVKSGLKLMVVNAKGWFSLATKL